MSTFTYARLEDRLIDGFRRLAPNQPGRRERELRAVKIYNEHRIVEGLSVLPRPPAEGLWIMSPASSITKLEKGSGVDDLPLCGLALAPHSLGDIDVCPHSGACADGCVAFAGSGGFPRNTRIRIARKKTLTNSPEAFGYLLLHDLDVMAERYPDGFGSRLNAFSDIRWERVLPKWFWERYRNVAFYDYTKHPLASRPMKSMPANYRLTYSWSEKTTKGAIVRNISAGRNVAVVLSTRGGKDPRTGELQPIPSRIGPIPVIDGDLDDRRYADEPGHIVALRRKGTLAANSPFVFHYDPAPV